MDTYVGFRSNLNTDSETLTAWHEAGHAVIGFALGGRIESVSLGGEANDWLPDRFGDCIVNWGPVDKACGWQRQREIMTVLAGPVAEMIYRDETLHPAVFPPWKQDWEMALTLAEPFLADLQKRTAWLESVMAELYRRMNHESCWAAIGAVADELLTHESLEEEQLEATIGFWLRHGQS